MTTQETIAVVGLACRFANGIDSPEKFWDFVMSGREATGDLPPERWESYIEASSENAARLRDAPKYGAFLDDIAGFDAEFFGISPREAQLMDPQQRIVLEVSWEALENAGVPPRELAGSDTGVFVGVGSDDYGRRLLEDIPRIEAWTGIGSSFCGVANRVSYTLDLRGSSMAIDTACSASLAAIHLACQSLRAGESTLALAGGVLIMAGPGLTVVLDAAGAVAPDGRCKSFDASADGYGRGEGAGIIVLKRLADAQRDGDRVLALVRGSAIHQEGKTNGIMAPSQEAQEHLLRRAYDSAGISPGTVDYVEAHATGTPTGDPIEVAALATVLGAGRPDSQPCLVGSVKPNIGHLEAGAGVAGVIKTILALNHGMIPPSRNVTDLNPAIDWDGSGLSIVTRPSPWPPHGSHPRRAGVSGFGYGGTIAHVVLEAAGSDEWAPELTSWRPDDELRVFPISSVREAGVREYAGRLADWLDRSEPGTAMAAIQYTLARRRSHLPCRAAVVARDPRQLARRLRAVADDDLSAGTVVGTVGPERPDLVWVFSGHGSQWVGMGRELLAKDRAFATVIDKLGPIFSEEIGFTPRQIIEGDELTGEDVIQPLIFAVQVGLSAVWRSQGVRPDAVIGHSVGEIAAVVAAGILSAEEGARLVCRRSKLLREVSGLGAMAMVNLGFAETEARLAGHSGVTAAISASPTSTVVAGDAAAVEATASRWREAGLVVRRINSGVAFHSPHMDGLLDRLRQAAADFAPRRPQVPIYSTALDEPRSPIEWDAGYWAANLRNPVRFAEAVTAAIEDGYRNFLEVSAHPVVTHSIEETAGVAGDICVAHTLRRTKPEQETLLANLAVLHCRGVHLEPPVRHADEMVVDLPVTGWRHRRFWAESGPAGGASAGLPHDPSSHTLLGGRIVVNASPPTWLWQTRLDVESRPYPGHHPVQGVEIIPAAVLLNTFLAAGADVHGQCMLTDVRLRVPVSVITERDVQVIVQDDLVRLVSRLRESDGDLGWLTHSLATTARLAEPSPSVLPLAEITRRCDETLDPGFAVDRLASIGVAAMGFDWTVAELRRGPGELFARVDAGGATWAAALDAALSIASVVFPGEPVLRMPAQIRQVTLAPDCPRQVLISARTVPGADAVDTVDVTMATETGTVVARLAGLRYGLLKGDPAAAVAPSRLVYELQLRETNPPQQQAACPPGVIVIGTPGSRPDLIAGLTALGAKVAELPAPALADPHRLPTLSAQMPPGSAVLLLPPAPADGSVAHPFQCSITTPTHPVSAPTPPPPRTGSASADDRSAGGRKNQSDVVKNVERSAARADARAGADGRSAGGAGPATGMGAVAETAAEASWLLARTVAQLSHLGTGKPRLWCVTHGVHEGATAGALAQSALHGLGRVAAGEHPELWGSVVDVAYDLPDSDLAGLLAPMMAAPPLEDLVVARDGNVLVERLVPVAGSAEMAEFDCRADGTYLITGGLGVLGLEVAGWLAGRGARRLVLAGRRGLPARDDWDNVTAPETVRQVAAVRELEAQGVTVRAVALDIADPADTSRVLAEVARDLPPIRGIVHAAGTLDNQMIGTVDETSLRTVLRPKVDGALTLHELFPPGSVDFMVFFSSCGQLLGLTGQASYAAGNAFLDKLAEHRRRAGHSDTLSLAWTSWRGLGMSVSSAVIDLELAARGAGDITSYEAFRCWDYAHASGGGHYVVLRILPDEPGMVRPPILREVPVLEAVDTEVAVEPDAPWREMDTDDLRAFLREEVGRQVAAETRIPPAELDLHRPLAELGLDSVMTTIVRRKLERKFGLGLPATLLWEHPTTSAIAEYLLGELDESVTS